MLALLELIADAIGTALLGAVPDRQPWRAIVTGIYLALAACGAAFLVWLFVDAL